MTKYTARSFGSMFLTSIWRCKWWWIDVSAVADADCMVEVNARLSDRAINSEGTISDEVVEIADIILEDMDDVEEEVIDNTADMQE